MLKFNNKIWAEVWRSGQLVFRAEGHNGVTTVGKNYMLDCMFGAAVPVAQVDPWYIGLINNNPSPTLLAADTLASHTGWTEMVPTTAYTGNRQAWTDADAASGSKGTTTVCTFPILGTYTIYGICVVSVATGTSGVLWATGAFDTTIPVINGDSFKVGYSIGYAA
jgi:hypothetical protein